MLKVHNLLYYLHTCFHAQNSIWLIDTASKKLFHEGKGVLNALVNIFRMESSEGIVVKKKEIEIVSLLFHSSLNNLSQNMMKLEVLKWEET